MTLKERIKRFGFARVLVAAVAWRVRRYLSVWVITSRSLRSSYELPPDHAANFAFQRLTLEQALLASQQPVFQMTADFVRSAFARGDICFGAFKQGELVAYLWRSLSYTPVTDQLQIRFDHRRQFYGYKSFVLPEYRGIRLIQSVGRLNDLEFIEKEFTCGIGYVAIHNLPSLTSYLRNPDQTRVGYAGFLSLGPLLWTFRMRAVRDVFTFERRTTDKVNQQQPLSD